MQPSLPDPWKKSPGRDRRLGRWERPYKDGLLVHSPEEAMWWFSVPRTHEGGAGDLWGNWEGGIDREVEIVTLAHNLHKRLVRAKWVQKDPGFTEERKAALMRMPRNAEMPDYFLKAFDRENLARGKAVVSGRLRVAGVDVHVDKPGMGGAFGLESAKYVSVTYAERSRKHNTGVHMSLDKAEAQAISDYFAAIASDTLTDDAWQAIGQARSNASHANLGVGRFVDASQANREASRVIGECMDEVAVNMARISVSGMRMLAVVSGILARGDAIRGLRVATMETVAAEGVDIAADPDTRTAALPPEEQEMLADIVEPAVHLGPELMRALGIEVKDADDDQARH